MRLRVLHVEGMSRPLMVIDQWPGMAAAEDAAPTADRLRALLPGYDVVLLPTWDVELPQMGDVT